MNEEKLFNQICERCENHAKNMVCEDMNTCPAYNLYLIAKSKRTTIKTVLAMNAWEAITDCCIIIPTL